MNILMAGRLSDEIVRLIVDGDVALWTQLKLRVGKICPVCLGTIAKGALAFKSIGNQQYRHVRIHPSCVDRLPRAAREGGHSGETRSPNVRHLSGA